MFINYKDYHLPIESIELIENDTILLLKTSLYTYKYVAYGDCCSTSIIKIYDKPFSFLIGKVIKGLKAINNFEYTENDEDYDDRYITKPHLYEMTFKNSNEKFEFLLINYSNGYYDGWIMSQVVI